MIHNVREEAFEAFENAEILFQDLDGVTYDRDRKPPRPNVIMCVSSRTGLPRATDKFRFPIAAWRDPRLLTLAAHDEVEVVTDAWPTRSG